MNKVELSIIITNYNGEKHLPELLDSIEKNIYSIKKNIEVLIMDDLSSDNSEQICSKYEFATFVNTDINHGQSFQRNKGLSLIKGDYFMFIDNDDVVHSKHIFEHIKYMKENNIDIIESKMQTFGTYDRLEELKKTKFSKTYFEQTDKNKFQYQAVWNKVYKNTVKKYIHFDVTRRFGEDLAVTYSLKLRKDLKIISTNDVFILYRKMNDESVSSSLTKEKFLMNIDDFIEIFNNYEDVPEYLYYKQYFSSYIYLSKIPLDEEIVDKLFSNEKLKEIYLQFRFWNNYSFGILNIGQLEYVTLNELENNIEKQKKIYELQYNKIPIIFQQYLNVQCSKKNLIFVRKAYEENQKIYIEIETVNIDTITVVKKNKKIELKMDFLEKDDLFSMFSGTEIKRFVKIIDITDEKSLMFECKQGPIELFSYQESVLRRKIPTHLGKKFVGMSKKKIFIYNYSLSKHVKNEIKLFKKEKDLRSLAYRGILNIGNIVYKNKIVFIDRSDAVGDNAESLLKYMKNNNKKEYKKSILLLSKTAKNFDQISKEYRVVDYDSFKAKILLNSAEFVFSSFIEKKYVFPVPLKYIDLQKRKYVYLQHGVNSFDMTKVFNGRKRTVNYVVCTTNWEFNEFSSSKFNYFEQRVKNFGMPRFDYLEHQESKIIYYCPTWRPKFLTNMGTELINNINETQFYKSFMEFTMSPKLHELLNEEGYELRIKLHPYFQKINGPFMLDLPNVKTVQKSYDDVFKEAEILVTDYSSVVYDASYNGSKTILFWPDSEEFFENCYYELGDFNHEEMGISPIIMNVDDLINKIKYYINNPMEEKYVENKKVYFIHNDRNNSKRCYDYFLGGANE